MSAQCKVAFSVRFHRVDTFLQFSKDIPLAHHCVPRSFFKIWLVRKYDFVYTKLYEEDL